MACYGSRFKTHETKVFRWFSSILVILEPFFGEWTQSIGRSGDEKFYFVNHLLQGFNTCQDHLNVSVGLSERMLRKWSFLDASGTFLLDAKILWRFWTAVTRSWQDMARILQVWNPSNEETGPGCAWLLDLHCFAQDILSRLAAHVAFFWRVWIPPVHQHTQNAPRPPHNAPHVLVPSRALFIFLILSYNIL